MSASVGESSNQEVDLNLAPIIDCFTVLITYLLVTASFLTLSAVDVGVSAAGTGAPTPPSDAPPPWVMSIAIQTGGEMAIEVRGGPDSKLFKFKVPTNAGTSDLERLTAQLIDIQKKWPTLSEVSVTAEPTVIYKTIVSVIHEIQNLMPKVYISG
jgi:biopolymer transport protein ExbD